MKTERGGRGFQTAGSLVPPASSMRVIEGSTPESSSKSSATGGGLPTVPTRSSAIGMRHGAHGAVALSLVEALSQDDPEATDAALLRSLPRSVASSLRPEERTFIDGRYGYDFELVGYRLSLPVPAPDLAVGAGLVERAMAPAPVQLIQRSLARLRAGTAGRAVEGDDLAMTMQVMAEECAEYPGDVVQAACLRWMRSEKWFPSLSELRDELQRLSRNRRLIAEALHGGHTLEREEGRRAYWRDEEERSRAAAESGMDAI